MKVVFLRHCQLTRPYANYDRLSFKAICRLAVGEIDPGIDTARVPVALTRVKRLLGKGTVTKIYHASSLRSLQMAKSFAHLLEKRYNKEVSVEELKELNEISFDPSKLMTEAEFIEGGMELMRQRVLSALVHGSDIEHLPSIYKRIRTIERRLLKIQGGNVLCITHGFLMRALQLHFLFGKKQPSSVALSELKRMINFPHGEGFVLDMPG